MNKTTPTRERMGRAIGRLPVGGHLRETLATNEDRLSAYYWARKFGFSLAVRKSVLGAGWEVTRVK